MTPGLPIGTRIDLDPSMKQIAADTVFGGSPARVLRLRPDGVAALAELRGGRVKTPASSRPRPPARPTPASPIHASPGAISTPPW